MKHLAFVTVLLGTTAAAFSQQPVAKDDQAMLLALLERLDGNPKDEQANLEAGKLYFFKRGEWNPGLFYLAQGSDKKLRLLAQRDLARPEMIEDRVALGDAWWDLGNKSPPAQRHLRSRAVHWYKMVASELSGLRRGRVESRIRMVESP